ncbi:MAG: TIGR03118 family protein [Alphaproteobacteria bacterium]|nr:TIGR03118 family protein [Alphaproteobacteria bacterium]
MIRTFSFIALFSTSVASSAFAQETTSNRFTQTNFTANKTVYHPQITEPDFINGWGLAIRPMGAGGHFWVVAKDISYEYVGDVRNSSDESLRGLRTDGLRYVKLPVGGPDNVGTGVAFSDSTKDFVIRQTIEGAEPILAPAKFLFASDGGIVSAWTERKKEDGTFDRAPDALSVIDYSEQGSQFFGLTLSAAYDRLYVADFGKKPEIKVFDGQFQPLKAAFEMPFDENKNGMVDPGEYAPFNVQALTTPAGNSHVFVTYAKTQACPAEEIEAGNCAEGALFVGEEDTSQPGNGRLAEFTEDGKLVAIWNDGGHLSAPWGVAYAPSKLGALSGTLLVGNFGDGTIAAYDPQSREFKDVLKDMDGKPLVIKQLWGILFGNGESLGDQNALYFAAGPEDEVDGLFGSLRLAP